MGIARATSCPPYRSIVSTPKTARPSRFGLCFAVIRAADYVTVTSKFLLVAGGQLQTLNGGRGDQTAVQ